MVWSKLGVHYGVSKDESGALFIENYVHLGCICCNKCCTSFSKFGSITNVKLPCDDDNACEE